MLAEDLRLLKKAINLPHSWGEQKGKKREKRLKKKKKKKKKKGIWMGPALLRGSFEGGKESALCRPPN